MSGAGKQVERPHEEWGCCVQSLQSGPRRQVDKPSRPTCGLKTYCPASVGLEIWALYSKETDLLCIGDTVSNSLESSST
ncbi:hypothetical protein ACOMHN_045474 [Nucella lapillus]